MHQKTLQSPASQSYCYGTVKNNYLDPTDANGDVTGKKLWLFADTTMALMNEPPPGYQTNVSFEDGKDDLEKHTEEVLQILKDNDLYLKPEKCEFAQEKITYLGFVIEHNKISMDLSKVKGILDWPAPTTIKQVRSFLGFGNFYRKFIRNYSDLAKPLNMLLQKGQNFIWSEYESEWSWGFCG